MTRFLVTLISFIATYKACSHLNFLVSRVKWPRSFLLAKFLHLVQQNRSAHLHRQDCPQRFMEAITEIFRRSSTT